MRIIFAFRNIPKACLLPELTLIFWIFWKYFEYFENILKIFWKYSKFPGLSGSRESFLPFETPQKLFSSLSYVNFEYLKYLKYFQNIYKIFKMPRLQWIIRPTLGFWSIQKAGLQAISQAPHIISNIWNIWNIFKIFSKYS